MRAIDPKIIYLAIPAKRMVILQNDRVVYEEMRSHKKFGAAVKYKGLLDFSSTNKVGLFYADLTGNIQTATPILEHFVKTATLSENCVVAFTNCCRDSQTSSYENQFVTRLVKLMQHHLSPLGFREAEGEMRYGSAMQMATYIMKRGV